MPELSLHCAEAFGREIIEAEYAAAHELLAPWLQEELSPAGLELLLEHAREGRPAPAAVRVERNRVTTPAMLRARWAEYYGPESVGPHFVRGVPRHGPPSRPIPAEIGENFRSFARVYFEPTEEDAEAAEADVSYVVWVLLVEVDGEPRIGWLEPTA